MKKVFIAAVLLILNTSLAQANLITNGSFETGATPGAYSTLYPGSTSITDWTIESGSIDYIGYYWSAAQGARSIDLSGNGPGSISQVLATTPGYKYLVEFSMGANTDGGSLYKILQVTAGTVFGDIFVSRTGQQLTWSDKYFIFTADETSTKLVFTSQENSAWGPALDNVRVTVNATPIPPAAFLLATGLIGLFGIQRKKRLTE
jgi:choice-of-anchor C domain-containing protein